MNNLMYFCTRIRLMQYLTKLGFKIEGQVPNRFQEGFVVWMFAKTPELMAAVDKYFAEMVK